MHVTNVSGPNLAALAMAFFTIALCLMLGSGQEADARNAPQSPQQQVFAAGVLQFGDVDCSTTVNAVDALKVLRYTIALSYSQVEPCEDFGTALPNGEIQGDVDCDNEVDPVDALKLLRYGAGLSVSQSEPCPDIGS